jgi:exopolyphosphatase/guanosine-5'-triphosphate,3'-diphosphate pyrophosphatase
MRVAVVDMGSNTFRLLVSEARTDGALSTLHIERYMLHLGGIVGEHGEITPAALQAAIDATRSMAGFIERFGVDRVIAVATAALRDAANGPEVADHLGGVLGVPVRILEGTDEARLSFLGVHAAIAFERDAHAVVDLGGGSLELALGRGPTMDRGHSWPIGVSRLRALVGRPEVIDADAEARLRAHVANALSATDQLDPDTEVVLIGGTVRAIVRLIADRTRPWVPRSLNQFRVRRDEIDEASLLLAPRTARERVDDLSVDPDRAEALGAAAVILSEVLHRLGVEEAILSDWGLRTGVILDGLGIRSPEGPEVRMRSVRALREEFLGDDPHPAHVADLVHQLMEQTAPLHGLTERERDLVSVAAHLHDIGRSLSLSGYHRHSAYLVEHADLRGISPDELGVVLSLVRFHRGGAPKVSYPPFRAMPPEERGRVRVMAATLQLADALDLPRDGSVQQVVAADTGDTLLLRTPGVDLRPHLAAMGARLEYAGNVLGRRVEVAG